MCVEKTDGFIVIHGAEFGLPCNIKCGPGLRPYGAIHFENRRNKTEEYDSSKELCMRIKNPEIIEGKDKCVFTASEIETIMDFLIKNKGTIQEYLKGFITGKGFIHFIRKKYAYDSEKARPTGKQLMFVQYDVALHVAYSAKDFVIEYKSKFGSLKYHGPHIPYFSPKVYGEEIIIDNCKALWPDFIKAEHYIEEHKDFLQQAVEKTEGNVRAIITRYLIDKGNGF